MRNENFDESFYLNFYRDVAQAVEEDIYSSGFEHYLKYGKDEGRFTSYSSLITQIESVYNTNKITLIDNKKQIEYLSEVVKERDNYIRVLLLSKSWQVTKPLRWIGRLARGEWGSVIAPFSSLSSSSSLGVKTSVLDDNTASEAMMWSIIKKPIKPKHLTSVILPVYRNVEMTKRCILAAMPAILATKNAKILAINDASPDVGMQAMLDECALLWPNVFFTLQNSINLGFVQTVNRGLAYFDQADVVLLNSDVIVPQTWLPRLIDEAYQNSNIGTVTPFSNNATICSFPHFLQENPQPFNLNVDVIDAIFQQKKLPCVSAPTGVGFCMYIRRSCLDEIGYLNAERFGRGYGEENDLCQRALKKGWLNIISPNIYAYHEGGVSFSTDKQLLVDNAMRVIEELHPNYHSDVQKFVQADPLRTSRIQRYIALLSSLQMPKILHISHGIGGGVGQHIDELSRYSADKKVKSLLLMPSNDQNTFILTFDVSEYSDKLVFTLPQDYDALIDLLKIIQVGIVHFHHTLRLHPKIHDLPLDIGVSYILTVHDFYWLNGNPTLTDASGKYPGVYSDDIENPLYPLSVDNTAIMWRNQLRPLIESAYGVIFPSESTLKIFADMYLIKKPIVAAHLEVGRDVGKRPSRLFQKKTYTIGVLGAIGREKGADLLEEMAVLAKKNNLAINFKLIGYAYRPLNAVETTGAFDVNNLTFLIQEHQLDIIFFPAQCPETYSYTLSFALDVGLPIIAPSIGAFPERLSERPNTILFPHLSKAENLLILCDAFIAKLVNNQLVVAPKFEASFKCSHDFYQDEYIKIINALVPAWKSIDVDFTNPQMQKIFQQSVTIEQTWRESVVKILWFFYTSPLTRRLATLVPLSLRRTIKRFLSRKPIHDILRSP